MQNVMSPRRWVPQISQRQHQPMQQSTSLRPMLPQSANQAIVPYWPQYTAQTQSRLQVPQINKPPSFNFAKSHGQLEPKRLPKQTPMDVASAQSSTQGKPNWMSEQVYYQIVEDDAFYYEEQPHYYEPDEDQKTIDQEACVFFTSPK